MAPSWFGSCCPPELCIYIEGFCIYSLTSVRCVSEGLCITSSLTPVVPAARLEVVIFATVTRRTIIPRDGRARTTPEHEDHEEQGSGVPRASRLTVKEGGKLTRAEWRQY